MCYRDVHVRCPGRGAHNLCIPSLYPVYRSPKFHLNTCTACVTGEHSGERIKPSTTAQQSAGASTSRSDRSRPQDHNVCVCTSIKNCPTDAHGHKGGICDSQLCQTLCQISTRSHNPAVQLPDRADPPVYPIPKCHSNQRTVELPTVKQSTDFN